MKRSLVKSDPLYNKWRYHKQKGNIPYFETFYDFKKWCKKNANSKKQISKKLKDQYRKCILPNQNGDFPTLEHYIKWASRKGYIDELHTLHKKDRKLPHSKKNSEFGFFYNNIFISTTKFRHYNFKYNVNKKTFYGYIKYKGETLNTREYCTFSEMLTEYCQIYKRCFKKDFNLT